MKKEAKKKSKLWLWLLIGIVVIAVAAVTTLLLLSSDSDGQAGTGETTSTPTQAMAAGRPELYWNIDKEFYTKDSESGFSTREPSEDGMYHIRFAYNGEQVELTVADKKIVNLIDTLDVMGLVLDDSGAIIDVIDVEDFAVAVAVNAFIQKVSKTKITANSSIAMNGMVYKIELNEETEIYNVSDTATVKGERIEATDFGIMDTVWVYGYEVDDEVIVTHVYMTGHPQESAVYWRAYQMWSSAEKSTSRVPDENGVYTIDFCSDGGIVTLKCKDKSLVTTIDNRSPHSCHFGFLFDEEGYIVEIINSGIGIRGAVAAERIEVEEIDGAYFSGTQLIPSDNGLSYSATLPEGCPIYDASSGAARNGVQGQLVDSLRLGDRVCVWTDPEGTPILVYIANRLQNVPAYYNLTRKYDGTKKETTRERNAQGYFEFEVYETGTIGKKIVKTSDKELATFIDSIANSIVGLRVNNGIIEAAYLDDDIFGWSSVYGGYIPQIQGSIISMVSFSKPDSPTNILMGMDYKTYDISGKDVPYGTETTLRVGDIATVTRNVSSNGVVLYITRRMVGGDKVYYNLDYQYNSTTKETKRVPDEEGWYYFTMAHNGEQVTVKTKNKELANKIDKSPYGDLVVVMRVVDGVAYEVYDSQAAYGQVLRSGYRIKTVNGDGTYTVAASTGTEYVLKMASDCKIYNVSTVFDSHRGERTYSLKPGDMVTSLADYHGDVKFIYVRQRSVDNIYANKQRQYDATNKVTLREPDADGYYWFELAVDGQLKMFKTKDKTLASQIDSYTTPFGLRVNGNEILNVTAPNYVGSVRNTEINGWDVTSVSKWSIGVQFNKVGYANTGEKKTVNLRSNVKVFDISPTAKNFGEMVELKKGDRIIAYSDVKKDVVYIFVLFHESRVHGTYAYCEHCKKDVKWLPWAGGSWDGYDAHYYLAGDIQYSGQANIGNQTRDYEIVLDLNGHKYEAIGSRGFLIRYNDALTIIDSVGGGSLAATGINGNGGTILMSAGGILNLHAGTLSFIDSENAAVKNGAVIYADSSTINVYGGTITGGVVNTSATNIQYAIDSTAIPEPPAKPKSPNINVLGGNIHIRNTTLNLYGGVVENGQAVRTIGATWEYGAISENAAQGGNIYASLNSVINLHAGAEIRNGYSNQHGGNVFITTSTLNMLGGKVYGGVADTHGGNLYNQFGGVLNVEAGVMENGTAGGSGHNYFGAHDGGQLHISGGKITGDITMTIAKAISISGDAKVSQGINCGLSVPSTVKLTIGELKSGAEVYINAKGAFSEANANAEAYVNAGYIKAAAERTSIVVKDNILVMQGVVSYCEHCGEAVEWSEWPGITNPASGHYFIAKDYKQSSQISIKKDTDVVLDLNGHVYSSTKIRNFLVRGTLSIMDSVGGGEMVTTGGAEFAGAIAMVGTEAGSEKPSGFNLYSGTLRLDMEHPEYASFKNAGLISFSGGELNIYGGTMIGGHVTQNGGVIFVNNKASVMNMFGGTIKGGEADGVGGCVYTVGTLNMTGGTIDGEVFLDQTSYGALLVQTPVIKELVIGNGVLIDVSGLEEGADIGINAEGTFTTEMESPEDYLEYLHSVDSEKDIIVDGNVLTSALGKGFFDRVNGIHVEAEAMTENGVFAAGGNVIAVCPVCGVEAEWIDIAAHVAETGDHKIYAAGHYYLSEDVTIATQYSFYADACLHLNGHNITASGRAIYVDATSKDLFTLNIMGKGTVSGAGVAHATIPRGTVDIGGSVNFYGGTFVATGDNPVMTARGYMGRSVVNVYDGAEFVGKSANMLVASQTVNVYGGKFTGGTTKFTTANANALNIYGGEFISDGIIIDADGAKCALVISGGSFTEGSIYIGANLASFTVYGNPVIDTLDLTAGKPVSLGNLSEGASIAVIASGAFTVENNKAADYLNAGYIKPAQSANTIYEHGGVLYMDREKFHCEHCGEDVYWDAWSGKNSPVSGHYYIASDFVQTSQISIVKDTDVVIDLRGNTYSSTKIRNFLVRGKLSIVDTVGGGEMVTTGGAEFAGGIALIGKESGSTVTPTFNIYGGTLKLDTQNAEFATFANGGLLWLHSGVVNIYGGTLIGGHVSENGGCIKVSYVDGELNIFDGTITGGTSTLNGGCIFVENGKLNMQGGTVDGEVYVNTDNAKLSGSAKIGKLVVAEGKLVDVSGLFGAAKIGIAANGVFTKDLTDPEAYVNFFEKTAAIDTIVVEGNALAVKSEDPIEAANALHEAAEKMTADGVFNAGGTITAVCPVCGTEEQWIDISTVANMKKITAEGHYYLSKDIDITTASHIGFYANACLHLNGHNITSVERAIYVEANYDKNTKVYNIFELNIMGEGTVSAYGTEKLFTPPRGAMDIGGTVNFYGGTYVATGTQNPTVTARGFYGHSVINIYEGTEFISPNLNLYVATHAVNVYGGKFTSGINVVNGANTADLNIYGGVFENTNADQDCVIDAYGVKGTLNIAGGVINGNVVVGNDLKSVTISGEPTVKTLDLSSGKLLEVGVLTGGNITVKANGVFTAVLNNADDVIRFFYAANTEDEVSVFEGALLIGESPMAKGNRVHEIAEQMTADGVFNAGGNIVAMCPVCEKEVTWEDLNARGFGKVSAGEEHHFYLSADAQMTSHMSTYGNICVHLNGHNMISSGRVLYAEYNKVNIMGEGVVSGSHSNDNQPRFASVIDSCGDVSLYGGTYVATTNKPIISSRSNKDNTLFIYEGVSIIRDASAPGLNVMAYDDGNVVMYGGIISGGSRPGENGGNIYVQATVTSHTPEFTIYGGVVENGTADLGGNIFTTGSSATVNICGGEIRNGEVYISKDAKSVTVSGAPAVSELDLTAGKLLTLGALKSVAEIVVDADGIFTNASAKAENYASCFKAIQADKTVKAVDGKLVVVEK